jgi:hypothetical protein
MMPTPELLQQAIQAARAGRKIEARDMLLEVVEADPHNELAWIWLTGLVDTLEDKIIACENVLTINPSNERVRAYLYQLMRQQSEQVSVPQPLPDPPKEATPEPRISPQAQVRSDGISMRDLAKQYEAEGKLEEALKAYTELAARTKDSYEFDRIYREITRLEAIQKERIQHVSPTSTIARMTFGWPLLYLFLALVQVGLNPIAHPSWYLWLGLPIVTVGGFLLALAEVRSRHFVWKAFFSEENEAGSSAARLTASIGGWILIILPHALMLLDSFNRLKTFQPPYPPLE